MKSETSVALAGSLATASAIGLARFAYTPLFPAMVSAGWLSPSAAGTAGALNLAGYLGGVLFGGRLARGFGTPRALDFGMVASASAFAACAFDLGLPWFGAARFVAGVAGGVLMAVTGPAVQAETEPARRGRAAGLVLAGVGAGVVVVAPLVPTLLTHGVRSAWLGLALLAVVLWVLARPRWPTALAPPAVAAELRGKAAVGLLVIYALAGCGITATFVYTIELATRARGMDARYSAIVWALFGVGGVIGSIFTGRACDMWGSARTLRALLGIQAAALCTLMIPRPGALTVATFFLGLAGLGMVAGALARCREIGGSSSATLWTRSTAAYSVAQAATAFALAAIYGAYGRSEDLFVVSLLVTVVALVLSFPLLRPETPRH